MTTPSPICTINGSATPQDVTSASTVNGALASTAGAIFWSVSIVGTDEITNVATVQATLSINQGAKTFQFTAPTASGSAVILQSTVGVMGLGLDANGTPQPSFTTTFKVNVKAANGLRVLAFNETVEQQTAAGWAAVFNPVARAAAGGGISVTGSGLVHVTSNSLDGSAYLGTANQFLGTNAAGTDTAWASFTNDLSTSTLLHQWVSGISGANGTAGQVNLGNGVNSLQLYGFTSQQTSPPGIVIAGSFGFSASNSPGGAGGTVTYRSGQGGAGTGTNQPGGIGGQLTIFGGNGGPSTGNANNANGGAIFIQGGGPGAGGSGSAGVNGDIFLSNSSIKCFATDNAAGPGFGIGTTPGVDPTITRGTGVPATTQPNGSLFLRTDGSSGTNGAYVREGGAWFALGGSTAATLTFEGQSFQLAGAGSGNGLIQWPQGQATPQIGQAQQANAANPANMVLAPQAPGASATNATTGTPGSLYVNLAAPVNGGTEAVFGLQRASTTMFSVQQQGASGGTNIYASQQTPSASNFHFQGSLSNLVVQAPANGGSITFGFQTANTYFGGIWFGQGLNLFTQTNIAGNAGAVYALAIGNATTAPTSNPSGGGILWEMPTGSAGSSAGTLTHRGLGGAIEQIAAPGTGTINTQLGTKRRVVAFLRTTSSTAATAYTYPMPAAGHTATIVTVLTATDATTLSSSSSMSIVGQYKNTAGTVTIVGAVQTPWTIAASAGAAVSYAISSTNILVQFTGAGSDNVDCTGFIDIYED